MVNQTSLRQKPLHPACKKKEVPEFNRLVRSWVRSDGGYVIEISKIDPDGKADAAYYTPGRSMYLRQMYQKLKVCLDCLLSLTTRDIPDALMH